MNSRTMETALEWLKGLLTVRTGVVVVAAVVALVVLRRLMAKPRDDSHTTMMSCRQCGWSGRVSRYKPRCSKCGAALL